MSLKPPTIRLNPDAPKDVPTPELYENSCP